MWECASAWITRLCKLLAVKVDEKIMPIEDVENYTKKKNYWKSICCTFMVKWDWERDRKQRGKATLSNHWSK